jgi:hypothetical protein
MDHRIATTTGHTRESFVILHRTTAHCAPIIGVMVEVAHDGEAHLEHQSFARLVTTVDLCGWVILVYLVHRVVVG